MRRFVAIAALALSGLIWLLLAPGVAMRIAALNAFVVSALLPVVMNPTRTWTQGFWRCFDTVYAAALVADIVVLLKTHEPVFASIGSCVIPGLLFGTMASLGIARSGYERRGS